MKRILEVIAFNISSCQLAQSSGAHRIELCDNETDGGTTPSFGMIKKARSLVHIDLFPIIRPRAGDFLYNEEEFEVMKEDVLMSKQLGCDGIVTGMLLKDGKVDKKRTSVLVDLAYPMSVTFHRAFDRTKDPFQSIQDIIECGCERILTSGQQGAALEGIHLINKLIETSNDDIIIMPGSGIRSNNIREIAEKTGAHEFHSSAKRRIDSLMQFKSQSLADNNSMTELDASEVEKMIQELTLI